MKFLIMILGTSLVSASFSSGGVYQQRTSSEFTWSYIPGAGDDEESWSRGLTPTLFWKRVYDLINVVPGLCNQKVAELVEKDRVYRAQGGENAPQITIKPSHPRENNGHPSTDKELPLVSELSHLSVQGNSSNEDSMIYWLVSTNIAVGSTEVEENLSQGKTLLVCCSDGEDNSICVCLAILISMFDEEGSFNNQRSSNETQITKLEMRRRLVHVCKYATSARPSRGKLKVFSFLNGGRVLV